MGGLKSIKKIGSLVYRSEEIVRKVFYKIFRESVIKSSFGNCGKNVHIAEKSDIKGIGNISIGDDVAIGPHALLWTTRANIIIKEKVIIGPRLSIITGDHKMNAVGKYMADVTDEEVEAKLKEAQEQNAREITVEDRAVQDGDIITLNYAGTVDGVAFDGGTAEDQQLVIGSHTFIDNFEEQLIGVEINGEKDVEVTFPEEYHAEDLAGKVAVFHVKVLGIKEKQLPAIDDDFAQDTTEFDTLEEYKNDIKEKLATAKEEQAKAAAQNALIDQIVESSEMDIPDAMVDFQVDQMVDEFKQRLAYQGLSLEQYVQFSGQSMDALRESM